jgi:hypothetical protein
VSSTKRNQPKQSAVVVKIEKMYKLSYFMKEETEEARRTCKKMRVGVR